MASRSSGAPVVGKSINGRVIWMVTAAIDLQKWLVGCGVGGCVVCG